MSVVLLVRITLSYSNLYDTTNSSAEIPEDGMQIPEQRVTLHLYVQQYVHVLGNGCTRYLLTQHWVNFKVLAEERSQRKKQ